MVAASRLRTAGAHWTCCMLGACTRAMPCCDAVQKALFMAAKRAAMVAASRAMASRCALDLLCAGCLQSCT